MSQFNLENVTIYTQKTSDEQDKGISGDSVTMDIDEKEAGEIAGGVPIDYNLYKKFWALQDFFRNPSQCYTPKRWKTFVENTKDVLSVFSSHKLEHITWKKKAKEMVNDMSTSFEEEPSSSDVPRYFSKFLTNEKLLDLQLSDSNFRRTILVQFLVLFQYLIGSVKFKSNNHVLTELQSLWVKETTAKVYQLIKETPPDGEKFANMIEHVFEREENWISWKNEGCPSFTKERTVAGHEQNKKATQTRKRKRSLGDEMASSWRSKKVLMGSPELTRLWNLSPDNLEACKAENRVFLPTLEKFFEEAIDQADPEAMVEEEYKVIKDSNFGWRALRLLARRSQHFFQPSSNPFKTLPEYLQSVVQQLATELPAQNVLQTPVNN